MIPSLSFKDALRTLAIGGEGPVASRIAEIGRKSRSNRFSTTSGGQAFKRRLRRYRRAGNGKLQQLHATRGWKAV